MPKILIVPAENFDGTTLTSLEDATIQESDVSIPAGKQYRAFLLNTVSQAFLPIGEIVEPEPEPEPEPSLFYPNVAPVNLLEASGSQRFPDYNNRGAVAQHPDERALLFQPYKIYLHGGSGRASYFMAKVSMPFDMRTGNSWFGIMGNATNSGGSFHLQYFAPKAQGLGVSPGCFRMSFIGNTGSRITANSPIWTEEEALVVSKCDGANNWTCGWVSLITGEIHWGETVNLTNVNATAGAGISFTGFNIGGIGTRETFADNNGSGGNTAPALWRGEIASVGRLLSNSTTPLVQIPDSLFSDYALGGNAAELFAPYVMQFYRKFDGTPNSLLARATNPEEKDTILVPAVGEGVVGSTIKPGSTIGRQSKNTYLTFDRLPTNGHVFGLVNGAKTVQVPLSGRAGGFSGEVEVRVYEAATGVVVRDWTSIGTVANGKWSGTIQLPESKNGWLFADVRSKQTPSLKATLRAEFGVGYKFVILGQSQMATALGGNNPDSFPMLHTLNGTYVPHEAVGGDDTYRIGVSGSDSMRVFANLWYNVVGKTPFMVISSAVHGANMRAFLFPEGHPERSGGGLNRDFAQELKWINKYGKDVSSILWNWATTNTANTDRPVFGDLVKQMLYGGTTTFADGNSFADVLEPGYNVGYFPNPVSIGTNSGWDTESSLMWPVVLEKSQVVGIAGSDAVTDPAGFVGHYSSVVRGASRAGRSLAILASRLAGKAKVINPYFANARYTAPNKIVVDIVCPNGGTPSATTPNAISGFGYRTGNTGDFTYRSSAVTRRLVGRTVEITKTDGNWPSNTQIIFNGFMESISTLAEHSLVPGILDGVIYETWDKDPLAQGLIVTGSVTNTRGFSEWNPQYVATPHPIGTSIPDATSWSNGWPNEPK